MPDNLTANNSGQSELLKSHYHRYPDLPHDIPLGLFHDIPLSLPQDNESLAQIPC